VNEKDKNRPWAGHTGARVPAWGDYIWPCIWLMPPVGSEGIRKIDDRPWACHTGGSQHGGDYIWPCGY